MRAGAVITWRERLRAKLEAAAEAHPPRFRVDASAGRTADGDSDALGLSSSGSDSAITGIRCRAFLFFV